MSANRINHATLALQQTRNLAKLLRDLKNKGTTGDGTERVRKELFSLSENLAATLANRRHYSGTAGSALYEVDPRFLLFEYCHGLLLRASQVELVHKLLDEMHNNRSVCHQMIMGAGKTTVVGPMLAMLLAGRETLIFNVVPAALLDFSAGVLRERFSAAIRKPVFTFTFDRYNKVTPQLLSKLRTARNLRAVVFVSVLFLIINTFPVIIFSSFKRPTSVILSSPSPPSRRQPSSLKRSKVALVRRS
jgi:hypothetical protein